MIPVLEGIELKNIRAGFSGVTVANLVMEFTPDSALIESKKTINCLGVLA